MRRFVFHKVNCLTHRCNIDKNILTDNVAISVFLWSSEMVPETRAPSPSPLPRPQTRFSRLANKSLETIFGWKRQDHNIWFGNIKIKERCPSHVVEPHKEVGKTCRGWCQTFTVSSSFYWVVSRMCMKLVRFSDENLWMSCGPALLWWGGLYRDQN